VFLLLIIQRIMDPIDIMIMADAEQQRIYKGLKLLEDNILGLIKCCYNRLPETIGIAIKNIVLNKYLSKRIKYDMIIKITLLCNKSRISKLYYLGLRQAQNGMNFNQRMKFIMNIYTLKRFKP